MSIQLVVPPSQMHRSLDEALAQGANLLTVNPEGDVSVLAAGYQTWDKRNQLILEAGFETKSFFTTGPKTDYVDFRGLSYPFGLDAASDTLTIAGLKIDILKKIQRLRAIKENLDVYRRQVPESEESRETVSGSPSIFVIHGRADAPRLAVQNLLLRATSHPPVVLMDQGNRGATIIEKLEEQLGKNAGFAVVILTGDDEGRLSGTDEMQPRARQNVILELGYAMGRLGRRNVTLLHEEGVELPSDINGVAYYPLDTQGGWQRHLLGDLKAAGFEISAEALLS